MRTPFEFKSFGELTVFGYSDCEVEAPKLVIIIVHGMAETIDRYIRLNDALVKAGYAVYGYDQRGHGKTAGVTSNLGILGEDGWNRMKHDLRNVVERAKSDYNDAKVVLFAHSMGSFLARDFLYDFHHMIHGVILSGTGFQSMALLKSGHAIASVIQSVKGPNYRSPLIDRLTFGTNTKRYKAPQTPYDWLSRDSNEVQRYIDDPMCGALHPVGFFTTFTENLMRILYKSFFVSPVHNMPMLLMSGELDPIGDYGKGVKKSATFYQKAGFDVKLTLYKEGRHEMLNEINREAVVADILKWLQEQSF